MSNPRIPTKPNDNKNETCFQTAPKSSLTQCSSFIALTIFGAYAGSIPGVVISGVMAKQSCADYLNALNACAQKSKNPELGFGQLRRP